MGELHKTKTMKVKIHQIIMLDRVKITHLQTEI